MHPLAILSFIILYFGALVLIAWYTGKGAGNNDFFIGSRKSHWYLVALGMIGDSLSGVTFISVPGTVVYQQFSYLQVVLGYLAGYIVINQVLLPLYYKLQLTSIYTFLLGRFGKFSQQTGSFYFLLSRLLGAAGRLFLAVNTIQYFVFDSLGIPFTVTVMVMIILMLVYTFKGGIKTLVWTDSLQSILLLSGLFLSILSISIETGWGISEMTNQIFTSDFNQIFFWEVNETNYFWKQFIGGAFIAISMTGLDQNMMQKNLSCPNLKDAQKNIYTFSFVMAIVNVFFVSLGALLYQFAYSKGITLAMNEGKIITDQVFPYLALHHLGWIAGIAFIVGLTAATFSSADSVLTTLTTSFCIDFLRMEERKDWNDKKKIAYRQRIHILFSILLMLVILVFKEMNNKAIIDTVLTIANYTYGPLLGLFSFGLFIKRKVNDALVPLICFISPLLCLLLNTHSETILNGYKFGYEMLVLNGLLTVIGLTFISSPSKKVESK